MARLRGYARVRKWRRRRAAGAGVRFVAEAAYLPVGALRRALKAVRAHGAWARGDAAGSTARQVAQLWWLGVRHGIEPATYYAYRLYRPGQIGRAPLFLQSGEEPSFYRMLAARVTPHLLDLLQSKEAFEAWLVENRLPTVRTLATFAGGALVTSDLPAGALPRADLFSKPDDSMGGRGTARWTFDGEGWVGEDGRRRGESELLAELAEQARDGRTVLLQRRARNHSAFLPLAPTTLSTLRVITLRDLDDRVRVVLATAKIPAGNASADHMRLGGVAAPVDVATGRLGPAARKDKRTIVTYVERHPDTGAPITGFEVPLWEEVKQLAVRAHETLGPILCVGWDIAVLEDGPVVVEGNSSPGADSSQLPGAVAMGETPVMAALHARLRASFAAPSRRADRAPALHPARPQ